MNMAYESDFTLRFRQTDMAGIGYFNQVFDIFHDHYEDFVEKQICEKSQWFSHPDWVVPLRHIEADYRRPLMAFEKYQLVIKVISKGESSFQLLTEVSKEGQLHCRVQSTHVFIDKKSMRPIPVPTEVSASLQPEA